MDLDAVVAPGDYVSESTFDNIAPGAMEAKIDGTLMGIPFAAAIERLDAAKDDRPLVGWAWAANGCGSVIGPVLAVLMAIDLGYTRVLLAAALSYGFAYFCFGDRWVSRAEPLETNSPDHRFREA